MKTARMTTRASITSIIRSISNWSSNITNRSVKSSNITSITITSDITTSKVVVSKESRR